MNDPPNRPGGTWQHHTNGKIRFICNDGRDAGLGKLKPIGWDYSTDWYFCCETSVDHHDDGDLTNNYEFSCKYGAVGMHDECPNENNVASDYCGTCDSRYELVGNECVSRVCTTDLHIFSAMEAQFNSFPEMALIYEATENFNQNLATHDQIIAELESLKQLTNATTERAHSKAELYKHIRKKE